MTQKIMMLLVAFPLLWACSSSIEDTHEHEEETAELTHNNGEKWTVVPKMMGFIRLMEKEIVNADDVSVEALKNELSRNLDSLSSNCTMEGEAHDALHMWLVPFMENVDALSAEMSVSDIKAQKVILKKDMMEFNRYFE